MGRPSGTVAVLPVIPLPGHQREWRPLGGRCDHSQQHLACANADEGVPACACGCARGVDVVDEQHPSGRVRAGRRIALIGIGNALQRIETTLLAARFFPVQLLRPFLKWTKSTVSF